MLSPTYRAVIQFVARTQSEEPTSRIALRSIRATALYRKHLKTTMIAFFLKAA